MVLAAQFESWRGPFVILLSVPLTIAGAMAFLFLGFASISIHTQVGLITLIGLIAEERHLDRGTGGKRGMKSWTGHRGLS
jgi:multidrug efflux pump subunit AcrB